MSKYQEKLWVEKYRPKKIDDCILPNEIKSLFKDFVSNDSMPNLLLEGGAGIGKTTIAKALCNEMDLNALVINASENGNIDTLRTDIRDFVSTVSLNDKHKVVILDEADYLSRATQPALRGFMEEFSNNARFILTCNFKNRILDALQSRCQVISFKIPQDEKSDLAKQFLKRLVKILKNENIEFDVKALTAVIKKYFPDFRKTINELNGYANRGKIDSGIIDYINHTPISEVIKFVKEKDYMGVSDWVETSDIDQEVFFEEIRKARYDFLKKESLPQFDYILWQYADSATRVQNPKINLQGFLVEMMSECEFKS